MAGQVDICNMALLELGANTIRSISEDTKEAEACRSYWPTAYDFTLEHGAYNFCRVSTSALTEDPAGDPSGQWSHVYHLPSNPYCIRVRRPILQRGDMRWEVRGRRFYADTGPSGLVYTGRVDFADMPGSVADALSYYLAYRMTYALTESNARKSGLWTLYKDARKEAQQVDGWEGNYNRTHSNQMRSARWGHVGGGGW